MDKAKKQIAIKKIFAKLTAAEIKFSDNEKLLNLISYMKMKFSIIYSA
jgi:hypothetical protein